MKTLHPYHIVAAALVVLLLTGILTACASDRDRRNAELESIRADLAAACAKIDELTAPATEPTACSADYQSAGYYAKLAAVTATDPAADLVTVTDCNGFVWTFYGVEDWQPGDCAALLMYDNGTETIYDDEVISARYERPDLLP